MHHILVRKCQNLYRHRLLAEFFCYESSEPAIYAVLLYGNDSACFLGSLAESILVERLDP